MTATPIGNADHFKMNFHIKGKDYTFKLRKQRFEKNVDKIDKMIHSGRHDVDSIHRRMADHLVEKPKPYKPEPVKPAKVVRQAAKNVNAGFDKTAHVHHYVTEYPSMAAGAIAKTAAAASNGNLTYANAYYIAKKLIGNRK